MNTKTPTLREAHAEALKSMVSLGKHFHQTPAHEEAVKRETAQLIAPLKNGDYGLIHRALLETSNALDRTQGKGDDLDLLLGGFLYGRIYPSGLSAPTFKDRPICKIAATLKETLEVQEGVEFPDANSALEWCMGFLGVAFAAGHRFAQLEAEKAEIQKLVDDLGAPTETIGIQTNARIISLIADLGFPELKAPAEKVNSLCGSFVKLSALVHPDVAAAYKELAKQTAEAFLAKRPDLYFQVFKGVNATGIKTLKLKRR